MELQNTKGHSDSTWSAFVRYAETKTLFMLYPQSQIFQAIPKRAFSAEDQDVLRVTLQRRIVRASGTSKRDWRLALLGLVVVTAFILVVWAIRGAKPAQ